MKEAERVPLKTILQNFLNHVESLEARRVEGEDTYDKEFQVSQVDRFDNGTRESLSSEINWTWIRIRIQKNCWICIK